MDGMFEPALSAFLNGVSFHIQEISSNHIFTVTEHSSVSEHSHKSANSSPPTCYQNARGDVDGCFRSLTCRGRSINRVWHVFVACGPCPTPCFARWGFCSVELSCSTELRL